MSKIVDIIHKHNEPNDKFYRKVAFLVYTEMLILGLKAEMQLRNKIHTKDWALDCQPADNGHVTH